MALHIRYLTVDEVIRLHDDILERLGAAHQPLRSRDALDSALQRVRQLAHYEDVSFAEQAAWIAISVSQCQAFVDGNKRTAQMATIAFANLNGVDFGGPVIQLAKFIELQAFLSMVTGYGDEPTRLGRETLAIWLESVMRPFVLG